MLTQEAELAGIETKYNNAKLNLEAQETLLKEGLISEASGQAAPLAGRDLKNRLAISQKQLENAKNGVKSQIAPQEAEVASAARSISCGRELEDLKVKAGMTGVLRRCRSKSARRSGRARTSRASPIRRA